MYTSNRKVLAVVFSVGALIACSNSEPSNPGGQSPPTNPTNDTDRNAIAVMNAANDGEIQVGQLGSDQAMDGDVKDFAKRVVKDHTDAKDREGKLAAQLGIVPLENDTSQSLRNDANNTTDALRKLSGGPFDRAYVDSQIKMHTRVLGVLDNELIPRVNIGELRQELQNTRGTIVQHLQQAQQLQVRIGPPSGP